MTLAVLVITVACTLGSLRLLVRASEDDYTPTRVYAACVVGMLLSVTAMSVAMLTALHEAVT